MTTFTTINTDTLKQAIGLLKSAAQSLPDTEQNELHRFAIKKSVNELRDAIAETLPDMPNGIDNLTTPEPASIEMNQTKLINLIQQISTAQVDVGLSKQRVAILERTFANNLWAMLGHRSVQERYVLDGQYLVTIPEDWNNSRDQKVTIEYLDTLEG